LERPSYVNGSMLSGEFALNNEITELYKKLLNTPLAVSLPDYGNHWLNFLKASRVFSRMFDTIAMSLRSGGLCR